jgi:predicted HD superfamily hydrolase involved in NAD metabolism
MNKIANINKLKKILRSRLNEKKYKHSVNVMKISEKLAKINNLNPNKIKIAALLHDFAKNIKQKELIKYIKKYNLEYDNRCLPSTLHGEIGSILIKKNLNIYDKQILDAVSCHTNGKPNMSPMEKILCVSDFIEKKKNGYMPKKIEEFSKYDINKALFLIFNYKIRISEKSNKPINKMLLNSREYMYKYIKNQKEILKNSELVFDNLILEIQKNIKNIERNIIKYEIENIKSFKETKIHNFKWFKPWTWIDYGNYTIKKELSEIKGHEILIDSAIKKINNQYLDYKNNIEKIFKVYNISSIKTDLLKLVLEKFDSKNYYDRMEELLNKNEILFDKNFNIKKIKKSNFKKIPNKIYFNKEIAKFNEQCLKLNNEVINNTDEYTKLFISSVKDIKILYFKSLIKI